MADERPRILVDINIFIDIIEKRRDWQNSLAVVTAVDRGLFQGYISALTKIILYFRRARIRSDAVARTEVKDIVASFNLIPLNESILNEAFADTNFDDVEDAVQFHSALWGEGTIITRNKVDYKRAKKIRILTPEEFLAEHKL